MSSRDDDLIDLRLVQPLCIDPRLLTQAPEEYRQASPASQSTRIDTKRLNKSRFEGSDELSPVPDYVYLTSSRLNESNETLVDSGICDTRPHDSNESQASRAPATHGPVRFDPRSVNLRHLFDYQVLITDHHSRHIEALNTHVCKTCGKSFKKSKDFARDLKRHVQSTHHRKMLGSSGQSSGYTCPITWCGKTTPRKDNLKRHIKIRHPNHSVID